MVDTPAGGYNPVRIRRFTMGKKVYSDEFKGSAVQMVVGEGHTMSSVAKRLGVNYHTLREWVLVAKSAASGPLIPPGLSPEQRIRELEKENARLRMERDILKKATAFFAKEHP
jgi:transposase